MRYYYLVRLSIAVSAVLMAVLIVIIVTLSHVAILDWHSDRQHVIFATFVGLQFCILMNIVHKCRLIVFSV